MSPLSCTQYPLVVSNLSPICKVQMADYGSYDGRSRLFQNGSLLMNQDGTINKTSKAVRNGDALVRSDGLLDERSRAVKEGDVREAPHVTDVVRHSMAYERKRAWEKAETIPGCNPNLYRKDANGDAVYKPSYGQFSPMGYNIDHSKAHNNGGTNHINNLNIMQSRSNSSKSDDVSGSSFGVKPVPVPDVDLRCTSVRDRELYYKPDGTVDLRSPAVVDGDVLVTQRGQVNRRSPAVKRGDVKFKQ